MPFDLIGPRPRTIVELVERSRTCDNKEKQVLHALSYSMISIFKDNPKPSYVHEAAAIASIRGLNLKDLTLAFTKAIVQGTADEDVKDTELLRAFTYVLWHTSSRTRPSAVLLSLSKRLKPARNLADTVSQYELIRCLSSVLDAMNEVKPGLDREEIHEPLLKQLKELSKSEDIRLAQAAGYAIQSLLGIPDNEGPWQALMRYSLAGAKAGTRLAALPMTMDITKAIDALPDLQTLFEGLKSVCGIAANVVEGAMESKTFLEGFPSRQKSWHRALRYTELLLRCEAWLAFQNVINSKYLRDNEHFLCGVYSQLEASWTLGNIEVKKEIAKLFKAMPASKEPIVHAWAKLVGDTIGESCIEPRISRLSLWKKEYHSSLEAFFMKEAPPVTATNSLLIKAWDLCDEAKLFYADAEIRHYYLNSGKLDIERISGEKLSMKNCYINLAVIAGKAEDIGSSFSLEERLQVEGNGEGQEIQLQDFFTRQISSGSTMIPHRIFIEGRAGVGKSTLCKKIIYEYLHGLWREKFDRILWLPLRRLKGKELDLLTLLQAEYFGNDLEHNDLVTCLAGELSKSRTMDKTLFLLDGLDEVNNVWDTDSREFEFLGHLLNKPNVIVTSRPLHTKDLQFDIELETIGFRPEEVDVYLDSCVNATTAGKIQQYLEGKSMVQSLVRIPIQLDALCYCWQTIEGFNEQPPTTMTTLYDLIIHDLWRKDYHRSSGRSDKHVRNLSRIELARGTRAEQNLIEWFAFQGLLLKVVEFGPPFQQKLYNQLSKIESNLPESYLDTLQQSSFLRSSDTLIGQLRTYHFLHLTFQEFFAARYFVRYWSSTGNIACASIDDSRLKYLTPADFIKVNRYLPEFDIFWRFVTGLVQLTDERDDALQLLLEDLEYPRERFGNNYMQLLLHCFPEVAPSANLADTVLRSTIEERMIDWVQRRMDLGWNSSLDEVLRQLPVTVIQRLYETSIHHYSISQAIVDPYTIREILQTCSVQEDSQITLIFKLARWCFRRFDEQSPDSLQLLVAEDHGDVIDTDRYDSRTEISELGLLLEDRSTSTWQQIDDCLAEWPVGLANCVPIPLRYRRNLKVLVSDTDEHIQYLATTMLAIQEIRCLMAIHKTNYAKTQNETPAISGAGTNSRIVVDDFAKFARHENKNVRRVCAGILSEDPEFGYPLLIELLQDSDKTTRDVAIWVLAGLLVSPTHVDRTMQVMFRIMAEQPMYSNFHLILRLTHSIDSPFLSKEYITEIFARLRDYIELESDDKIDANITRFIVSLDATPFSEEICANYRMLLHTGHPDSQVDLAKSLYERPELRSDALAVLVDFLKDTNDSRRTEAAEFLFRRGVDSLAPDIVRVINSETMMGEWARIDVGSSVSQQHLRSSLSILTQKLTTTDFNSRSRIASLLVRYSPSLQSLTTLLECQYLKVERGEIIDTEIELTTVTEANASAQDRSSLESCERWDNSFISGLHFEILDRKGFYDLWPFLDERQLRSLCLLMWTLCGRGSLECYVDTGRTWVVSDGVRYDIGFDTDQSNNFLRILTDVMEDPRSVG